MIQRDGDRKRNQSPAHAPIWLQKSKASLHPHALHTVRNDVARPIRFYFALRRRWVALCGFKHVHVANWLIAGICLYIKKAWLHTEGRTLEP